MKITKEKITSAQKDFIQKIKNVYLNCNGYETFGNFTEFYDEDGCVLMTATQSASNTINFSFDNNESYRFQQVV